MRVDPEQLRIAVHEAEVRRRIRLGPEDADDSFEALMGAFDAAEQIYNPRAIGWIWAAPGWWPYPIYRGWSFKWRGSLACGGWWPRSLQ